MIALEALTRKKIRAKEHANHITETQKLVVELEMLQIVCIW